MNVILVELFVAGFPDLSIFSLYNVTVGRPPAWDPLLPSSETQTRLH